MEKPTKTTNKKLSQILQQCAKNKKSSLTLDLLKIKNKGMELLCKNMNKQLKDLYLVNCGITGIGLECMRRSCVVELVCLDLSSNNLGNMGMKMLAKADLHKIKIFRLENCKIGDEGIKNFSKTKCPLLYQLTLFQNPIKLNGYEALQLCLLGSLVYFVQFECTSLFMFLFMMIQSKKEISIYSGQKSEDIKKIYHRRFY